MSTDDRIQQLSQQVEALRSLIERGDRRASSAPNRFMRIGEAIDGRWIGHENEQSFRVAIGNGQYKSGTEVQKRGKFWYFNPATYDDRLAKEQSRRKVC